MFSIILAIGIEMFNILGLLSNLVMVHVSSLFLTARFILGNAIFKLAGIHVILMQIIYTIAMLIESLDKDDDRDETDEDSEEEMEKDRLKDLDERDKFAERLKKKDKEKQRSVMSKSEKKVNSAID